MAISNHVTAKSLPIAEAGAELKTAPIKAFQCLPIAGNLQLGYTNVGELKHVKPPRVSYH